MQEALTNVYRHSGSRRVDVALTTDDKDAVLVIKDFGKGIPKDILDQFRKSGTKVGVGLAGIRERVKELGGTLEILSNKKGTVVKASVPISERAHDLYQSTATSQMYSSLVR
jgi:signal transduction histidine kinase